MIGIRSLKWARPRYVDAFGVEGVTPSPGRAWQGSGEASKKLELENTLMKPPPDAGGR
jgi:hypothetical protein